MRADEGTPLGPWVVESVDPERMKELAVLLADPNRIHLDPEAVRAAGLGDRVINQGPANCGYVMNMLREQFPDAVIRDFKVRFLANVRGGDRVIAAGRVEAVDDDGATQTLSCSVWLDVDGGARALEGAATIVLAV
jgi:3-hydroxybutyryl-CoA dehydratase